MTARPFALRGIPDCDAGESLADGLGGEEHVLQDLVRRRLGALRGELQRVRDLLLHLRLDRG